MIVRITQPSARTGYCLTALCQLTKSMLGWKGLMLLLWVLQVRSLVVMLSLPIAQYLQYLIGL